jgi:quercetin dioxygenase-like cupin family protein
MLHRHPEDRVYTVVSGVFYVALGGEFDSDKSEAYPPGSAIVLPGNTSPLHPAEFSIALFCEISVADGCLLR